MTAALGKVRKIALRLDLLNNTKGSSNNAAAEKRNKVSENELMTPANFSEARKDPATSTVANNTNK